MTAGQSCFHCYSRPCCSHTHTYRNTHTHSETHTHTHTHIWGCISSRESDKTTAEMKTHIVTIGGWRRADRVRACGADIFLYPSPTWGWWICEKGCSTSTSTASINYCSERVEERFNTNRRLNHQMQTEFCSVLFYKKYNQTYRSEIF